MGVLIAFKAFQHVVALGVAGCRGGDGGIDTERAQAAQKTAHGRHRHPGVQLGRKSGWAACRGKLFHFDAYRRRARRRQSSLGLVRVHKRRCTGIEQGVGFFRGDCASIGQTGCLGALGSLGWWSQ